MHFGLSETQQAIKNSARQFLAVECPMPEVRRLMQTETAFDSALWSKFAEQGWTGIIFPEKYDGSGLGMVEMAAALEEMGRSLVPGPFVSTVLLAGGTYNSPQLLQLSGIGPAPLLQSLGITVRHALGGVGEGLQDHYAPRTVARVRNIKTINERARGERFAAGRSNAIWTIRMRAREWTWARR